jgi:hypothetical protein
MILPECTIPEQDAIVMNEYSYCMKAPWLKKPLAGRINAISGDAAKINAATLCGSPHHTNFISIKLLHKDVGNSPLG